MNHHRLPNLGFVDLVVQNQKDLFGSFGVLFAVALDAVLVDCPGSGILFRVGEVEFFVLSQILRQHIKCPVDDESEYLINALFILSHGQFDIQQLVAFGDGVLLAHFLFEQTDIVLKLCVVF